jgi:hypothetical protein
MELPISVAAVMTPDNDHLLIGIGLACWARRDFHDIFSSRVHSR